MEIKMKRIFLGLMAMALGLVFVSCENDDTDFSDIIAEYQAEPVEIELDFSALSEVPDVPVTDENDSTYNDYVENSPWNKVIYIAFNGENATVTNSVPGVAVQATGAHVIVTNMSGPVKFVLSGSTTNGSIKFYGDKRFQILLNGVDIENPTGAAINNQGSKSLYVVLAEGTANTLHDGSTYTMVDEEDQKAALFSEGQIIFSGTGTLNAYAVGRAGIRSDDYIRIRPGVKIYVNSTALDGIRANDGIIIDGGVINIETSGNGAKGMRSEGPMAVNGGRVTAITRGDTRISTEDGIIDTTACAALACDTLLVVNNGTLRLKATGDGGKGLNAKQSVDFKGGVLYAVAEGSKTMKKPKGVKIDGNFSVTDGYFYSYSRRSDPLEVEGRMSVAEGYKTYQKTPRVLLIEYLNWIH